MDTQSVMAGPPDQVSIRTTAALPKVADQEKLDALLKKLYAFKPAEAFQGEVCPLTEEELLWAEHSTI